MELQRPAASSRWVLLRAAGFNLASLSMIRKSVTILVPFFSLPPYADRPERKSQADKCDKPIP